MTKIFAVFAAFAVSPAEIRGARRRVCLAAPPPTHTHTHLAHSDLGSGHRKYRDWNGPRCPTAGACDARPPGWPPGPAAAPIAPER